MTFDVKLEKRLTVLPPLSDVLKPYGKIKIVEEIVRNDNAQTITGISHNTGLNHTRVKIMTSELVNDGILTLKQFGRIKIFIFNDDNITARRLKFMFNLWINESAFYQVSAQVDEI